MPDLPVTWARAGDRYPDLKDEPGSFMALDGNVEVGIVKFVAAGIDAGSCMWSMLLTHPGLAFKTPTNGTTATPKEAARELLECWRAFRQFPDSTYDRTRLMDADYREFVLEIVRSRYRAA